MILQGVGHQISCLGVCYANDPQKRGYTTPAPALDLTTSLRGDFEPGIEHWCRDGTWLTETPAHGLRLRKDRAIGSSGARRLGAKTTKNQIHPLCYAVSPEEMCTNTSPLVCALIIGGQRSGWVAFQCKCACVPIAPPHRCRFMQSVLACGSSLLACPGISQCRVGVCH